MAFTWSNEDTLKFLELYFGERLLWDSANKDHKLRHKVNDAWRRISVNMGNVAIEELKSKKKSLMATFRPLLKKKKASIRSGAGAEDVFNPIWFAFELMESYLGTTYDVEDTINTEATEDQESQIELVPLDSPPTSIQPSNSISNRSQTQDNITRNVTTSSAVAADKTSDQVAGVSRSRLKKTDPFMNEAQRKINESFDTLNSVLRSKRTTEEDECDLYGKLLAKKLRKYPAASRDRIMYKIDGLLLDNPPVTPLSSSSYSSYASDTPAPQVRGSPTPNDP
ncbi:hypothetical protein M8J76_011220 [Diaphorina citri]|nr:hypothetical protein M8J76_011220 [Diaphorina citri]